MGIALSAALVADIAPVTAIAVETSSPTSAAVSQVSAVSGNSGALQTEDAAAAKEKAYAAMQEALKNLEAAEDAASSKKIAEINDDIAYFQERYDEMAAQAAKWREPLPTMQADVDAAQAKYDEAHNRVSELQAKYAKEVEALGGEKPSKAMEQYLKELRHEIMAAKSQEESCEMGLDEYRHRLEIRERQVNIFEGQAKEAKAHIDEETAKREVLFDNLKKAQAAYDDACKAYEEAKAAADKAASPEITQPTETTPPSGSAQPAETAQPASSPATGKDAAPSSTKQANSSNGKQATTTAGKLANTGDPAPSAIALAGIAAMGLGITATATRRIKYPK